MMGFLCAIFVGILLINKCDIAESCGNESDLSFLISTPPLKVNLTLIQGAAAKGAVCLDGTVPGYHLDPGHGSGANSWLVNLEGGGWCNSISSCDKRKKSHKGSSNLFEKQISFTGILSPQEHENPDFYNWNKIMIRYCDGAMFSGDGENKTAGLQFRGQRIWEAAMEELMSKGMRNASQALLAGCSAGGVATILHCDEFRDLFRKSTKVKCLSDAGLFVDAVNIIGGKTLSYIFDGMVRLQGVEANLPANCTNHLDPTSCFFPQNIIPNIKTPLFLLNSAYDSWQVHESLAPETADPQGNWNLCRNNITECSPSQIQVLKGFRDQILNATLSTSVQSGYFITSCFAHCQSVDAGWFTRRSRALHGKTIATSVGDWYFDRAKIKGIDKAYPSKTITC